jgi:hypothetical protein
LLDLYILQKANATAYHQALNHLEFMRQPRPANIGGDSKEILDKNMKKKYIVYSRSLAKQVIQYLCILFLAFGKSAWVNDFLSIILFEKSYPCHLINNDFWTNPKCW